MLITQRTMKKCYENSRGTIGILVGNILSSNDEVVLRVRVRGTIPTETGVDKLRGVKFFVIIFSHFDNPNNSGRAVELRSNAGIER